MLTLGERCNELGLVQEDKVRRSYIACSGPGDNNDEHYAPLVRRSPLAGSSLGHSLGRRRQMRSEWTRQEEEILVRQHRECGNSWSAIAEHLPERTAADVKDIWHSALQRNTVRSSSLLREYVLELQKHGVSATAREMAYRAARLRTADDDGTSCKNDDPDITVLGVPAAEEETTSSGKASDPAVAQRHTALLGHHVNPQLQQSSSAPAAATGTSSQPRAGILRHARPGPDGSDVGGVDAAQQAPPLQRSRQSRRKPKSYPQGHTQAQGHAPDEVLRCQQQTFDRPAGDLKPPSRDPRRVVKTVANQHQQQTFHRLPVDDDLECLGFAADCRHGPELDLDINGAAVLAAAAIPRKRVHSSFGRGPTPAQPAPAAMEPGHAPRSHQVDIACPRVLPLTPHGSALQPVMWQGQQQLHERVAGDDVPRGKRQRRGQQQLAEEQSAAAGGSRTCCMASLHWDPHDDEGCQQHQLVDREGVPFWREMDEDWAADTGLKAVMEEAVRNGASPEELAFLQMMWKQSTATMVRGGCPQAMGRWQQDDGAAAAAAAVMAPLSDVAGHAGGPAAAVLMPPTKGLPLAQRLAERRLLAEAKALVEAEELYRLTRLRLCLAMQLEQAEEQRNGGALASHSSPSAAAPAAATASADAAVQNGTQAATGRCALASVHGTAASAAIRAADAAGDRIPEEGTPVERPCKPPGRHEEVKAAVAAAAKVLALNLYARVYPSGGLEGPWPTAASMQRWVEQPQEQEEQQQQTQKQQQELPQQEERQEQQQQKRRKQTQEQPVDFVRRGNGVSEELLDTSMRIRKVSAGGLSPPICPSGAIRGRQPQAPDETRQADDSRHQGHGAAAVAAGAMAVPSAVETCHQRGVAAKRRLDRRDNTMPDRMEKKQRKQQTHHQLQLRQTLLPPLPQRQQVRSRQRQRKQGIQCNHECGDRVDMAGYLGVDGCESDVAKALLSFSQFMADPGSSRGAAK
ncbi:hypothetical protein Vretimale_6707 [Volvox reticuliferus]|uniref:Uncharacterized protein n=1 Tax=Volvox reticuliferus TaxID=1737510 RepID=A0A8J4G8I2_9CHLO|nr:hypothetical protein Vretifemale_7125 [Volvox reticuliferus]GIM02002.1 hypothetical protein Vretimale_6707 [Volvox reticuliferus]